MSRGKPNKRYTPEFKKVVVETMMEERLSYSETCRRLEVNSRDQIMGTNLSGRRARRLDGRTARQRLRAENDYLKTCKPWFWKTSDASAESAGSSKAEAKTFSGYSSLNRSTAPCNFLLSFEADAER